MAVSYLTLFEDIGAVIKAVNILRDVAADGTGTSIPGLRDNLYSVLNSNSTDATIPNIGQTFDSFADQLVGRISSIADLADTRITDFTTILDELKLQDTDIDTILSEIIKDMEAQADNVNASVVAIGAAAAAAANYGDGLVLTTKLLDASPPSPSYPGRLNYIGKDSELAVNERLTLTCTSDSDNNGLPRGHEFFEIRGETGPRSPWDWKNNGSGEITSIPTDNFHDVMANRNFEVWSSTGELSNWDSVIGAPGVEFAANYDLDYVHGGTASMQILDDCTFEQAVPPQIVQPNRLYRISFWLKADSTSFADTTLSLVSPSGAVTIPTGPAAAGVSGGTGWANITGLVQMPANLSDDLTFRLTCATVTLPYWIDRMSFSPVHYIGGIGVNILAGETDFSIDDRFTVDLTNTEGVIQQFARKKWGVQLPSDNGGSETIADSLAQ